MRVPTKSKCFICLETIRNEFMSLGKDLLAAKLNCLQRRGACCKKSEKKMKNFDKMEKNCPKYFFSNEKEYFDQKLPEESKRNSPDALQIRFLVGIGSFCCEKVEIKAYLRAS